MSQTEVGIDLRYNNVSAYYIILSTSLIIAL